LGKTGADFAHKDEIFAAIGTQQECAEMLTRSGRRRESADDKLLFLMHLDLEPFAGSALFIRSIAILRDHPFEAPALGNAVSGKAILSKTARKQELLRRLSENDFQLMPAARKRFGAKIPAIAINAIKYCEARRNVTTLEELEARKTPFGSKATTSPSRIRVRSRS
jgi:hypothetical protein